MQDRRKYPRVQEGLPLKIRNGGFDIVTETENISCIGAYCRVNKYIPPMTRLKIILLIPIHTKKKPTTQKVECQGVIVRVEDQRPKEDCYKIAIYFNEIKKKDMQKIARYVEQRSNQSG